jgi:hypothetical protein
LGVLRDLLSNRMRNPIPNENNSGLGEESSPLYFGERLGFEG